jgi:hypothetical protein
LKLKEVKRIVKAAVPFELAIPIEKDIVGWWLRTVGVQTVFRRVLLLKTTMLPRSGSRRPPDYLTLPLGIKAELITIPLPSFVGTEASRHSAVSSCSRRAGQSCLWGGSIFVWTPHMNESGVICN